jgi:hypothetical protein
MNKRAPVWLLSQSETPKGKAVCEYRTAVLAGGFADATRGNSSGRTSEKQLDEARPREVATYARSHGAGTQE